jgi:hypothetical protein
MAYGVIRYSIQGDDDGSLPHPRFDSKTPIV